MKHQTITTYSVREGKMKHAHSVVGSMSRQLMSAIGVGLFGLMLCGGVALGQRTNFPPECANAYKLWVHPITGFSQWYCLVRKDAPPCPEGAQPTDVCYGTCQSPGVGINGGGGAGGGGSPPLGGGEGGIPPIPGGGPPASGGEGGSMCDPCTGEGMARWFVKEPDINLFLQDVPFYYSPSRGNALRFKLRFKGDQGINGQIDNAQPAIFGVGTNWHTPWRAYVQMATNTARFVFLGDAGVLIYELDATNNFNRASLTADTNTPSHYTLRMPNGTRYYFNEDVTLGTVAYSFLSKIEDHNSNTFTFSYTVTNNNLRLSKITDVDNRETTFTYTNTSYYSNLITQVNGPYGLSAVLAYNTNSQLISIKDVVNLESQMTYDSSNRLSSLITPYGTNQFDYYATNGSSAIRVTEAGIRRHLYLGDFTNNAALPSAASEESSLASTLGAASLSENLENSSFGIRNTMYWGPRQYANLPSAIKTALDAGTIDPANLTTNDLQKGRLSHWLKARDADVIGTSLSLRRNPSPRDDGSTEGLLTWFDYAGKPDRSSEGSMLLPMCEAKREPGGQWQIVYTTRSVLGYPLSIKETYTDPDGAFAWRTSSMFQYAPNLIDLTQRTAETNSADIVIASGQHVVLTNEYNSAGQLITSYNAVGDMTTFAYDGSNRLTNQVSPTGLITDYTYGTNGFLATVIKRNGSGQRFSTNSYTWDSGRVQTQTDARGLTTTNTWDALGRLVKVSYPDGTYVTNVYDKLDLVKVVDRMGSTNSWERNRFGQALRSIDPRGNTNTYQYCDCGSLESLTDPLGYSTQFTYDNLGRLVTTVRPGGIAVTNTYNLLNKLTVVTDSAGASTTNTYSVQGLISRVENSAGLVQAVAYDAQDYHRNITNANGVAFQQVMDGLGRVIHRLHESFVSFYFEEFYEYSASGLIGAIDALGYTTRYGYDELGRKVAETNANSEVTLFSYSPGGDLLSLTDGKSHTTSWNYDLYGRVTNKVDAASNVLFRYKYDAQSRLTNRWSAAKGDTYYTYDSAGNLTFVNYPVSADITLSYDALNRVTNIVDGVGTTRYGYTTFGALLSEDGPWENDVVAYQYTTNGLRSRLTLQQPNASDWVQSYTYDGARRLTNSTSPAGPFAYDYDPTARLMVRRLTLPNGSYITNSYDSMGRTLSTVLKSSGNAILNSHAYDVNELGQRTKQTRTDGSYVDYLYDNAGQLTSALGKEPGGTTNRMHEQLRYTYDAAGNLSNRVQNILTNSFAVDTLNQLTKITRNSGNVMTVAGTTSGNATNVTVNSSTATRYADNTFAKEGFSLANGNNTFTAVAKDNLGRTDTYALTVNLPSTNTYIYDLNGNLRTNGTRIFDYDDENQLIRVTESSSWKSEFAYDGKMRRRVRTEYLWQGGAWATNEVTRYVYDGNLVVQERDGLNAVKAGYTRGKDLSGSFEGAGGIGGLLSRSDISPGSAWSDAYYHADGNGNVTMLVNTQQVVVAKYLYDPFGNVLSSAGSLADANLYRFSSKELHAQSGLVYYLYRFYDPNLQRWPNRDPLGETGFELLRFHNAAASAAFRRHLRSDGGNGYGFVRNQPLNRYDPLGLAERGPNTEACKQAEEQADAAWKLYESEKSDENLSAAIGLSLVATFWCTPPKPPTPPEPPKCPWWQRIPPFWRWPLIILDPCIANPFLPGCGGGTPMA